MGKFFGRSSKSSPAPSDNPYAQPNAPQDPYANGSSKTSMSSHSSKGSGLPSGPRAGFAPGPQGGAPPPRGPPSPQPPPSYGSAVSGYGSDRHGSGGGYGANPYKDQNQKSFDQNQAAPATSQPFRPGGYGGLGPPGGRPDGPVPNRGSPQNSPYDSRSSGPGAGRGGLGRMASHSTEVDRADLLGGGRNRGGSQQGSTYTTKPVTGYGQSPAPSVGAGAYGGGYGEEREPTEEDLEQEKYLNTLGEKKQIKQDSNASLERSVQTMHQMFDIHEDTAARLARDGDTFANANKNMDIAENYNTSGYEKARDLQKANSSMFAMHVGNPFTAKSRALARDEHIMERHRAEKGQREETRRDQYNGNQKLGVQQRQVRDFDNNNSYVPRPKDEDNPYAYEDDEEEVQLEDNIEKNLGVLSAGLGGINLRARQTAETLADQNRLIAEIASKTDRVDDGVRKNRNELDKVR